MPAPPYSAGTETPSSPSVGHLRQDVAVELVRAVELANARRHFARAPVAHRLFEHAGVPRTTRNRSCTSQLHRIPHGHAEPLGGTRRVRRALEVIGAAEQRADLARRRCRHTSRRCARSSAPPIVSCSAPAHRSAARRTCDPDWSRRCRNDRSATTRPRSTPVLERRPSAVPAGQDRRSRARAPAAESPFAIHAAAGAKRSRPSNVRLTVGRA